jgi:hypothetical protein
MSDHDPTPDPMDKAYVEAEAILSDEAARAARRARVLATVASGAAAPTASAPPIRRTAWRRGGWLVAAGVGGLSVFLATQVYPPAPILQPPAPPTPAARLPTGPETAALPPRTAAPPAQAAKVAPRAIAKGPRGVTSASRRGPAIAPSPPVEIAQAAETPPAAAGAPRGEISEIVVTGTRIPGASRSDVASAPVSQAGIVPSAGSSPTPAAKLRAAAAAGRTAEVAALLAKGVPVDAADDDGSTALMKAIQADHPATAALLRRHGASPDLQNRTGASARDMATSIGDAALERALGPGR